MRHFSSLRAKVIIASSLVAMVVALVIGLTLYINQIKPIKQEVEAELLANKQTFIDAKIDLKIQSGIIGATMLSIQPETLAAFQTLNVTSQAALLKDVVKLYSEKTNFRGIFAEFISNDKQVFMRSWNLDAAHTSRSDDSLLTQVLTEKKAVGALGFGERGVTVTSYTPVLDAQKRLLGAVTMIQGVGSISRDYQNEAGGAWIMLIDRDYVQKRFGHTKPIEKLNKMTERYVLANNRWFSEDVINLTKQVYAPVDGDQRGVYLAGDKVVVDIPAYDQDGRVFARQIFIDDASIYTHVVQTATNQAWFTLIAILVGILALAAILLWLINRLVVNPLRLLNQTMAKIKSSGDFKLRVPLSSNDEVGETAQAINQHLESVSGAIMKANSSVSALAQGRLDVRIDGEFVGDLQNLQQGVNKSIDNVQTMIYDISATLKHLSEGQFSIQAKTQAQGVFADIMNHMQDTMHGLNEIIGDINQTLAKVAQGEFKPRVHVQTKGELDKLKSSINSTLGSLESVIQDISNVMASQSFGDLTARVVVDCEGDLLSLKSAINENAQHLNDVMLKVNEAVQTVSGASSEVANGSNSLSESVQQMAASVEQTSATMTQINAAIKANAENAASVDHLEHQLQENSHKAAHVMHETIVAMNAIQASSEKIGEIVALIDGIAFQTNLLALNAAVEAARAGDHGRGFAVVAGEVRGLAQKSAEAAKDIKRLIDESVASINQGTELAAETEQVLNKMNDSIAEVTKMIAQIASTSAEQARGVGEINQAIALIDGVTQQNAALVEQTSAAAESLKDQAYILDEQVRFFKIEGRRQPRLAPLARPGV